MKDSRVRRAAARLHPIAYWFLMALAFAFVGSYLYGEITTFRAFSRFSERESAARSETEAPSRDDGTTRQILAAIQSDRNQADYYAALGTRLFDQLTGTQASFQDADFDDAQQWLQQAVLRDPANPWLYYELGRLSAYRGDCTSSRPQYAYVQGMCMTLRYYLAALNLSPKSLPLRQDVLRWYLAYDRAAALQLLKKLRADDRETPIGANGVVIVRDFAKFLYEMRIDYISDLEAQKAMKVKEFYGAQINDHYTDACEKGVLRVPSSDDALELGNDDGAADWQSGLHSTAQRIKKSICLPAALTDYRSAALKIFMSRRGHGPLPLTISVNEHALTLNELNLSYIPRWHEIPIPLSLLQDVSSVTVYMRATEDGAADNAVNIGGDRDTPTANSMFGFRQTSDLSPAPGLQTGEYMIRLALRK